MIPMLFGITVLTFVLLDLVPGDRALQELRHDFPHEAERAEAVLRLRVRYGLVDPETGERRGVIERYGRWLSHAVRLDFASPGETREAFNRRFLSALSVSALLGFAAFLVAFGIGVPLGAWLGMRTGSATDRSVSVALLLLFAVPELISATLLLLVFSGGFFEAVLPSGHLFSDGSGEWPLLDRLVDLGKHLIMPVTVLAIGPVAIVTRFVRDSVSRTKHSDFALTLRAWGLPRRELRRRILRNSLAPVATLFGLMLPTVVTGSVATENVFSIPGIGRLGFTAVLARHPETVMAVTLLVAVVTLVGMILSDVLQRVVDPRVELR